MRLGIAVYSNDPETIWNAFRFANFALAMGDAVSVFLLGKGVELESLDTDKFNVAEQVKICLDTGGKISACGVCLQTHEIKATGIYTVSSMKDLYAMVKENDKVVTF
jgi:sulfur relay (sulfurtransferase) complex TusBCD TusD component (DsrE family)